jgi:hypothetical protein
MATEEVVKIITTASYADTEKKALLGGRSIKNG